MGAYFDGRWTNDLMVVHYAFLPGHDARTAAIFFCRRCRAPSLLC